MNPLCVTATTDKLSDIGRRNIENLKQPRRRLHRGHDQPRRAAQDQPARRSTQVGDISWPEHVTIFTIPVRIAVQIGIPLIVWGENSQNEYGGPAAAAEDNVARPALARGVRRAAGPARLRPDRAGGDRADAPDPVHLPDRRGAAPGRRDRHLPRATTCPGTATATRSIAQAHGFETYPQAGRGLARQLREPRQRPDRHPRLLQVPQVRLRPRHRPGLPARPARPASPRRRRSSSSEGTTASSRGRTSARRSRRSSTRST